MIASPISPRILSLDQLEGIQAGGKANGLYRLIKLGFAVPPGFVVLDVESGVLPPDLVQHYEALGGGLVAVRSSALDEDGSDASFAGQYETVLNVEGVAALQQAVLQCVDSLLSHRAASYRGAAAGAGGLARTAESGLTGPERVAACPDPRANVGARGVTPCSVHSLSGVSGGTKTCSTQPPRCGAGA